MDDDTVEQEENSENEDKWTNLRPWQFKPGQSGNPSGRPKGSISLKQWAKNMIQTMTDEEKLEFLKGLNKHDIWKMAEGNPENKTDIDLTSKGESINLSDPKVQELSKKYSEELKKTLDAPRQS